MPLSPNVGTPGIVCEGKLLRQFCQKKHDIFKKSSYFLQIRIMKLYFSKNLLIFSIRFFITSCEDSITSEHKEAWGTTTATIVEVEACEDKYG